MKNHLSNKLLKIAQQNDRELNMEKGYGNDFIFFTGKKKLFAFHKIILKETSKVLKKIIDGEWKNDSIINIEIRYDYSLELMREYIYFGSFKNKLDLHFIIDIIFVADEYYIEMMLNDSLNILDTMIKKKSLIKSKSIKYLKKEQQFLEKKFDLAINIIVLKNRILFLMMLINMTIDFDGIVYKYNSDTEVINCYFDEFFGDDKVKGKAFKKYLKMLKYVGISNISSFRVGTYYKVKYQWKKPKKGEKNIYYKEFYINITKLADVLSESNISCIDIINNTKFSGRRFSRGNEYNHSSYHKKLPTKKEFKGILRKYIKDNYIQKFIK